MTVWESGGWVCLRAMWVVCVFVGCVHMFLGGGGVNYVSDLCGYRWTVFKCVH